MTPFYDRAADVIYVSMTDGRAKTANLRRDPRAAIEVTSSDGWAWATAEGPVTLTGPGSDPNGPEVEVLVNYYRSAAGEHPGLGRIPVGHGLRPQGADGVDRRARLRRKDPLTRDGFTNSRWCQRIVHEPRRPVSKNRCRPALRRPVDLARVRDGGLVLARDRCGGGTRGGGTVQHQSASGR